MSSIKAYLKRIGGRRFMIMIIGNIFIGAGISIFKLSGQGNDPFSAMIMALSDNAGMSYANFLVLFNLVLFFLEAALGREFIGLGTAVNAFSIGYIVTFFNYIWNITGLIPAAFSQQVITVFIGVIICSFGVSLYQTSGAGVAPYDSLALIMEKRRPKLSYFWHRIFWDGLCALVCFFSGGLIGLGTLVSAFGLGPVVHFFNRNISEKLIKM